MSAGAGGTAAVRVAVAHRLFTNAPGGDGGAGFRHRRIGDLAEGGRVESWLESLRPAADGGLSWGAAGFRLGGTLHLAVARVDGAFRPDEHGRGRGHLAHALVAAAGEGGPDLDLAADLVAAAERLARPAGEAGDLETMMAGCASLEAVECLTTERWWRQAAAVAARSGGAAGAETPAAGLPLLAAGDAPWLAPAVLAASAGNAGGAIEVSWPLRDAGSGAATAAASASATAPGAAAPETAAARAVAASSRLLPPRLRLALRWSVAARPLADDRLRIVLAPASGPPPPALAAPAAAYADWLRDRLAVGDGAAVAAVAADWQVRSWRHLVERLGAAVAR